LDEIESAFEKLTAHNWLIDATDVAVGLGNPILSNIVMLGVLTNTALLPINRRAFEKEITRNMSADKRGINLTAFDAGAKMF